jgi:hypothetical protein
MPTLLCIRADGLSGEQHYDRTALGRTMHGCPPQEIWQSADKLRSLEVVIRVIDPLGNNTAHVMVFGRRVSRARINRYSEVAAAR